MFSLPIPLGVLVLLAISKSVLAIKQDSCGPDIQTVGVLKTFTTIISTGPTPITSLNVINEESLLTQPHLCYTHTVLLPYTLSTTNCGKVAQCMTQQVLTEYRPQHDACCDATPTVTQPSPSPTCRIGCGTKIMGTTTVTLDSYAFFHPAPTSTALLPAYPIYTQSEDEDTNPKYYNKLPKRAPERGVHPASATPPPLIDTSKDTPEEEDNISYPCTRTVRQMVTMHGGGTTTFFPNTYTTTSTMDGCDGCRLVVAHWGGPGPMVIYTATVTDLSTQTATRLVCKPTGD